MYVLVWYKATSSHIKYSLSSEEAANWYGEKNSVNDVFIKNIELDNGEMMYEGSFEETVELECTKYPINTQI